MSHSSRPCLFVCDCRYWLKIIKATSAVIPCPVVLVGTHSDDPLATPQVMQDIADKLKKYKAMFSNIKGTFYVNTPQGQGIKELRKKLIELAATQKVITTLVPQSYHVHKLSLWRYLD